MGQRHGRSLHLSPLTAPALSFGRALLAAALCTVLGGCAADGDLGPVEGDESEALAERAYPGETGETATGTFNVRGVPETLEYELLHGHQVYQGDIVLDDVGEVTDPDTGGPVTEDSAEPPADLLAEPTPEPDPEPVEDLSTTTEALVARRDSALWPGGRIYYTVDPSLPNKDRVWNAIRHWHAHTPIRFVKRESWRVWVRSYVTFTRGSGCSANIGRRGGRQYVWLANHCTTGNTIHEIGHTVGLWHEQARTDRSLYITVHWDNIDPRQRHNFQTYTQRGLDGRNVGRYDLDSIMHYGAYAFSRNGRRTISVRSGQNSRIGQRRGLSARDIAGIRAIY